jgi:hypothetical protein
MLGFVVVAERDFKIPFTINCCNALSVLPKLARAALTFANSKACDGFCRARTELSWSLSRRLREGAFEYPCCDFHQTSIAADQPNSDPVTRFVNSATPPKQPPDRKMLLNASGEFFPLLPGTCATSVQTLAARTAASKCFSKFQFNGGGRERTYIGFTHSAFS